MTRRETDPRRYRLVWVLWLMLLAAGVAAGNWRLVACCVATVAIVAAAIVLLVRTGHRP